MPPLYFRFADAPHACLFYDAYADMPRRHAERACHAAAAALMRACH